MVDTYVNPFIALKNGSKGQQLAWTKEERGREGKWKDCSNNDRHWQNQHLQLFPLEENKDIPAPLSDEQYTDTELTKYVAG